MTDGRGERREERWERREERGERREELPHHFKFFNHQITILTSHYSIIPIV